MSAQFGSAKIGAMQYNGLNIAEARYNGQVVFKAKPNLSPATLGAVHWLPFTNSVTEDSGNDPGAWTVYGSPTLSGGALTSGQARLSGSEAHFTPIGGWSFTQWITTTKTLNALSTGSYVSASYSRMDLAYNGATRAAGWTFQRGATSNPVIYAGTVPTGWVHIGMCMEPVSGNTWRYRAYINGAEVLNATYDAGTQHPVTFTAARADAAAALVDDFAVYNHALTAQEIVSLYQLGRTT